MTHDDVMAWVAAYERGWRDGDLDAVATLFTEDVRYRLAPYEPAAVGHAAVRALWIDDERTFTVDARPVAVEGDVAVVQLEVRYGDPVRREYRDLWLLRFVADGRVADFEEWAYWPDKPYTARDDGDQVALTGSGERRQR